MSGKGRTIAIWTLSGLAAFAFLGAGAGKLTGAEPMVATFEKIGAGQWFRYLTGVLEVGGAIGLFIPGVAFFAAALLAMVMAGAVVTHLALLGGSPVPALVLLMLTATIAYLRKP
jgi:putative oxidoreductase